MYQNHKCAIPSEVLIQQVKVGIQEFAQKFALLTSFYNAYANDLKAHFEVTMTHNENEQSTATTTVCTNLINLMLSVRIQELIQGQKTGKTNPWCSKSEEGFHLEEY